MDRTTLIRRTLLIVAAALCALAPLLLIDVGGDGKALAAQAISVRSQKFLAGHPDPQIRRDPDGAHLWVAVGPECWQVAVSGTHVVGVPGRTAAQPCGPTLTPGG